MAISLLLFEGSSWSSDLSQITTHLLMHCLNKPHKLVDTQVLLSSLFLKTAIAEYFLVVNYHIWLNKCTLKTCENNIAFP